MIKSINTIRMLGIEAVNKANSGHPGIVLGAAPMAYTLFTRHLRINPGVDKWINRDRFILSAGHGSALLYALLHLSGFNITIHDLQNFRQINSLTPGHPESYLTPGVDVTTGPLGQGIAMAVGSALAEAHLGAKYNKPGYNLFDHYTYVLCGDGDLQEGVAQEAISLAGHWNLKKLIVLFDSNDVQLDNMVSISQNENIGQRFIAANWNYILVKDGNNVEDINSAIEQAKQNDKPTLIEVKTVIGYMATKQGTSAVHGSPLGNDIETVKKGLEWKNDAFIVDSDVYDDFNKNVKDRGIVAYEEWVNLYQKYATNYPEQAEEIDRSLHGDFKINLSDFKDLKPDKPQATRVSSGAIIDRISNQVPGWIGGSADLAGSTKAKGADGIFQFDNYQGRNIAYGVREFAMAAINNGIYSHGGLLPFCGGFFVFSDYMKPAIRLSSLMEVPVVYVLSHDSVAVGEDGPTHQPIEQLAMLRSQPNLHVFRPADFNETLGAYWHALQQKKTPSAILITRQDLPQLNQSSAQEITKGGYVVYGTNENNDIVIFATGSEVHLAIEVAEKLEDNNLKVKVVSMPSWELFECQEEEYRNKIIEKSAFRVSIELGTTFGWERYTGENGLNIGINRFGRSGPFQDVLVSFNFTSDAITNDIIEEYQKK